MNSQNEDMMRRILASQRTIIEQNQKIIKQQEQAIARERDTQLATRDKIPLILKVSSYSFKLNLFNQST